MRVKKVGTIFVDSGCVWLGDPRHIGDEMSDWSAFSDKIEGEICQPLGNGIGLCVPSGAGDGEYPVYVERAQDGTITTLIVEFDLRDEGE